MHGLEVRDKRFSLDFVRYHQLERDGRLVWVVARHGGIPVGYACGFWYRDLHFAERVAADDLWFVHPAYRGQGLGRRLKEIEHAALALSGAVRVYDNIRNAYNHPTLMRELGFKPWGTRWKKTL